MREQRSAAAPSAVLLCVSSSARSFLRPSRSTARPAGAQRLDGLNVIATPDHPFGSPAAGLALERARRLGAKAVAIIPFLWQANPTSTEIVRGADMPDSTTACGDTPGSCGGPRCDREAAGLGAAKLGGRGRAGRRKKAGRAGSPATAERAAESRSQRRRTCRCVCHRNRTGKDDATRPNGRDLIAASSRHLSRHADLFRPQCRGGGSDRVLAELDAVGVTLYPPSAPSRPNRPARDDARGRRPARRTVRAAPANRCWWGRSACVRRAGRGKAVGERRGTGKSRRSAAAGRSSRRLAWRARPAIRARRVGLAMVHRSRCRRRRPIPISPFRASPPKVSCCAHGRLHCGG